MKTDVSNTWTYQTEQETEMGGRMFVRREREIAKVMQILACININGREKKIINNDVWMQVLLTIPPVLSYSPVSWQHLEPRDDMIGTYLF